ncbi:hypothetical protein [Helicobacter sp. T3_23-1056]
MGEKAGKNTQREGILDCHATQARIPTRFSFCHCEHYIFAF